jgi:hypothetical protein
MRIFFFFRLRNRFLQKLSACFFFFWRGQPPTRDLHLCNCKRWRSALHERAGMSGASLPRSNGLLVTKNNGPPASTLSVSKGVVREHKLPLVADDKSRGLLRGSTSSSTGLVSSAAAEPRDAVRSSSVFSSCSSSSLTGTVADSSNSTPSAAASLQSYSRSSSVALPSIGGPHSAPVADYKSATSSASLMSSSSSSAATAAPAAPSVQAAQPPPALSASAYHASSSEPTPQLTAPYIGKIRPSAPRVYESVCQALEDCNWNEVQYLCLFVCL